MTMKHPARQGAGLLALAISSALASPAYAQVYTKTEETRFKDDSAAWVLGQVESFRVNDIEVERTEFDGRMQPNKTYAHGKLQHTLSYHVDGNLAYVTDGRNNVTALSQWKRGIPQRIDFPMGESMSAVVSDTGTIPSVTDERGSKTCYDYDGMGRLTKTTFPSETQAGVCDESRWAAETASYQPAAAANHGLPAGHWVVARRVGNRHVNIYLDAMWRPVLEEQLDAANVNDTLSQVVKRYDTNGRLIFQSYPKRWVDRVNENQGTHTTYDALGRVTRTEQDSEHGRLATTTEYLPQLQVRTTNPRGYATTNAYKAYDQPNYDLLAWSVMPEGAVLEIVRNGVDKPISLKRRNTDGTLAVTRHYRYDAHMQLCRTIEPETGSTAMSYDAAGNLEWSASGLDLPLDDTCRNAEAAASGRLARRYYDARNRLTTLNFPDRNGDQTYEYLPGGAVKSITTLNDAGATSVINGYAYSRRGQLTGESSSQPGWYGWSVDYGYDALGNLSTQTHPTGASTSFAPNALGQPTQVVSSVGTFATGVSYYPNGAIRQFTYGNGIVHSMAQNARQLPERVTSSAGVADLQYTFDANGNPKDIYDHARGGVYNRHMAYDGLDRLTDAGSWAFGGDAWHRFTYDALDNIRSWKLAGVKDYADYYYNPANNRLEGIRNSAGATVVGLIYDAQGNLYNKNGRLHYFDYGNRLRGVEGRESYRYDGHGRRVLAWRPEAVRGGDVHELTLSMYSQAGQILFEHTNKEWTEHYYLAGSLIGDRTYNFTTSQFTNKYFHTDALGSPVATTNTAGQVVDRTDWDPYGAAINEPAYQGIGYTGHVMDGATGLTYMQQRYYDPSIARFLSVDPVTAYGGDMRHFNRYAYAFNNPYKFYDPDGRQANAPTPNTASRVGAQSQSGAYNNVGGNAGINTALEYSRVPKGDKSSKDPDLGAAGNAARFFLDSDEEREMFNRYWLGLGDMRLSAAMFREIVAASSDAPVTDTIQFGNANGVFLAHKYDFYDNAKIDAAIGSGWIIYDSRGSAVGFFDRYDFNGKPWGERGVIEEVQTMLLNIAEGRINNAKPYNVTYGIYAELP